MILIKNPNYAYCLFFAASDDLPKGYPFRALANRIKSGMAHLWVEGKNSMLVTSIGGADTLFIDLIMSKTVGAISRNFDFLISILESMHMRYLRCKPLGESQRRLYRQYGFYEQGDEMEYDNG